jgi:hypothetical protein
MHPSVDQRSFKTSTLYPNIDHEHDRESTSKLFYTNHINRFRALLVLVTKLNEKLGLLSY